MDRKKKDMPEKDMIHPLNTGPKLLFAYETQTLLDRHLILMGGGQGLRKHLVTTYYDSPDLLLRQSGLSLCIRRSGRQRIQVLKVVGEKTRQASHREEWKWAIRTDRPDLSVLSDTPYGSQVTGLNEKLVPVWVSDMQCVTHMIQYDGAMIEAVINAGDIRAGNARERVRRLELTFREGPERALYSLALAIQAVVPLRLGVLTESDRGYHLLTGTSAVSRQPGTPLLTKKMTPDNSFRALICSGLHMLIQNQPAAEAGDPEGIHQMRVAIRQLRTMLQMIEGQYKDTDRSTLRHFQSELRRIGRELGVARDWDVLCLETLPTAFAAQDGGDLIHMLDDAAQEKRTTVHQQLCQELETPALITLILSLAVWIESADFPGAGKERTVSVSRVAATVLDRLARKVGRRGRHIRKLSPEERHALRKSLKKLRYGAHYFATLYPSHGIKSYMKRCKKLLRHLGEINDATVATTLIRILGQAHPDLAPVVGIFARWNDKRRNHALRALPAAWKVFRHAGPFWR
ncbi:CYTH and CHAD domain-containing protein [Komagataeibacter europaeus]|uniref:CYTH and CHAD domain-containing protein n=1 Tax=Komagataeibacter europaeus TaxID=33995 RepID=UPI0015FCA1FA|nr:CHAD domain-containing protein [Komagataeibacter europaeus]